MDVSCIAAYMLLEEFGHQMRDQVKKEIGLTIDVGFGPFKMLAKLAKFIAKKWIRMNGIVGLSNPDRQRKLMALVSVNDVWGIGSRLSKRLHAMNISTALQLAVVTYATCAAEKLRE